MEGRGEVGAPLSAPGHSHMTEGFRCMEHLGETAKQRTIVTWFASKLLGHVVNTETLYGATHQTETSLHVVR